MRSTSLPNISSHNGQQENNGRKESVQVFIRVRPPFNHEIDEDNQGSSSFYYPSLESAGDMNNQLPLWSCVQVT